MTESRHRICIEFNVDTEGPRPISRTGAVRDTGVNHSANGALVAVTACYDVTTLSCTLD